MDIRQAYRRGSRYGKGTQSREPSHTRATPRMVGPRQDIKNGLDHDVIIECSQRQNSMGKLPVWPGCYYEVNATMNVWSRWFCNVWQTPNDAFLCNFECQKGLGISHKFILKQDGIYKTKLNFTNPEFIAYY